MSYDNLRANGQSQGVILGNYDPQPVNSNPRGGGGARYLLLVDHHVADAKQVNTRVGIHLDRHWRTCNPQPSELRALGGAGPIAVAQLVLRYRLYDVGGDEAVEKAKVLDGGRGLGHPTGGELLAVGGRSAGAGRQYLAHVQGVDVVGAHVACTHAWDSDESRLPRA